MADRIRRIRTIILTAGIILSVVFYAFSETGREQLRKAGADIPVLAKTSAEEVLPSLSEEDIRAIVRGELNRYFIENSDEDISKLVEEKLDQNLDSMIQTYCEQSIERHIEEIILAANEKDRRSGLININTADMELLMTLPGIGRNKASAILAYRESNGSFRYIEDVMNIPGIKEAVFLRIRELITV